LPCARDPAQSIPAFCFIWSGKEQAQGGMERMLNKESGLKGLSGLPGGTRVILPEAQRQQTRSLGY
jgi:acetate kinase